MATQSQIEEFPCPSCFKFIPNADVTNDIGRKMNVKRFVAFVKPVTSTLCSLERLVSSMAEFPMIVDLPASHNEMRVWIRDDR